jgi:CRP/FNR family transcriptional regulator, cyclic AMP receptor protein
MHSTLDLSQFESQFEKDVMSFQQDQHIFEEGETGKLMYLVKSGEVEIVKKGKVIDHVNPGGVFGEMALIDSSPRSATARAKTDCELIPVDEYRFLFLVQHAPYFSLQVMGVLAERIRALMEIDAQE